MYMYIDPEFLNIISGSDIVGLAELHAHKALFIPGKQRKVAEE